MGEGERFVELFTRGLVFAEVDERFTEACSGESFAADRACPAAKCCGFEQVRARRLEIAGQ